MKTKKVVLAYSGGLDTSVCLKWLVEKGYEVIAYVADVGQESDFLALRKKALACGASKIIQDDLKKEFVDDYIVPALRANAVYQQNYYLATALSRPLIAKHLVQVALRERCEAIAHGCTGQGNDQVRFEVTIMALAPHIKIIAPLREWEFKSREEEIEYANAHGIPLELGGGKTYSLDQNLWGCSIECGPLEDPWVEPPKDAYQMSVAPEDAPDEAEYVEIFFEKGVPKKIGDTPRNPMDIIAQLNEIGARYGVGRSDLVEDRLIGIKSREIYEAPAGYLLHVGHRELEALVLDKETREFKESLSQKYAELVYNGLWEIPLKKSLDAFFYEVQRNVTGTTRLKLFKGSAICVGRNSTFSLYKQDLATYGPEGKFDQKASEGFIKIWGLPYS